MAVLRKAFAEKNVCMPGRYFSIIQVKRTEEGRGLAVLFIWAREANGDVSIFKSQVNTLWNSY
ncbi:hypothetical protein BRO54_2584 [Geobacillus proteiniphilus]|uniref:Uncharacterized protein n=1 Tax=Geobacillus proteiniphilus TaxID=860353 RepID=A0A1Q5SV10_9BACL|nr:hypothetical protein BRO54_2584 [Geobacillus proteiniphilus]